MNRTLRDDQQLHEKEIKLIKMLRKVRFGEVRIIVQDSLPIRVEEVHKSIDLKQ